MKVPRFYLTDDHGLVLETAIALSPLQRNVVRDFAIKEYKRRIRTCASSNRDQMVKIITLLETNNFIERPIPAHDCDKESLLFGK